MEKLSNKISNKISKKISQKNSITQFLIALFISVLLLVIFSPSTNISLINSIKLFLTGSFTSVYYAGSVLNNAVLIFIAGLGAAVAINAGFYNLGGEGQIYAGGFVAAVLLHHMQDFSPIVALPIAFIFSAFTSSLIAIISIILKQAKNASVLLTSFIISSAIIIIIDGLITGPARGETSNLLATPFIVNEFRFLQIMKPSPLSIEILFVPILCALANLFLYKTKFGKEICIMGKSYIFAKYAGYDNIRLSYCAMAISGALHGVCGFVAVCGSYYTCHVGFYNGMGWNALSASLIAYSNPVLLLPSSLVLSWLFASTSYVSLNQNFSFDMSGIIQGILLLSLSIRQMSIGFNLFKIDIKIDSLKSKLTKLTQKKKMESAK